MTTQHSQVNFIAKKNTFLKEEIGSSAENSPNFASSLKMKFQASTVSQKEVGCGITDS